MPPTNVTAVTTALRRLLPALATALLVLPSAHAEDAARIAGRWITQTGNLAVDIGPCEASATNTAPWCGRVAEVRANHSMSHPGDDIAPSAGPDAVARTGLLILTELRPPRCGSAQAEAFDPEHVLPQDCATWTGTLYNRETGRRYSSTVTVDGQGRLLVRPYVGLPLFGRTLVWTRDEPKAGG